MRCIYSNLLKGLRVLLVLSAISCADSTKVATVNKKIQLSKFSKAVFTEKTYTDIRILETYPNEEPCKAGKLNANLYVCLRINSGDTVYVFDSCQKVAFAMEKLHENFALEHKNIKKDTPSEITIVAPQSFSIPGNAKYVLAGLTRLED
ncbi:hypothetical protein TH53_24110 [Pedobacter lusitanus]|uniref:Lipoprotein n=1 Tax=Pedobacter lusitanus TaxID=1503925 RepID=A0A0D0GKF4_9SPHI|nr:hypothetical protein [Pedobacter lusitanus]KIO74846.1 hypothetical protein TH53_24110 [Pedobacter lusitanus]